MAITWGTEVKSSSGNGMKLGFEFSQSPSSVGASTTSVVVTLKLYFWSRYSVSDSTNSYSVTGEFSGSGSASISHGGSGGTTLLRTLTRTVSPTYAAVIVSAFSATITGIDAVPGTARVSGSWSTEKRPYSPAADVSGLAAVRSSDARQVVSWTNNATASAPYESIFVDRWDNVRAAWYSIATLSGTATSYTDSSTAENCRYQYRVIPKNSAGNDGTHVYSNFITTTQTPPSAVKATKRGGDIEVSWANNGTAADSVEVWHASNGVWESSRLALLSGTPASWTHASPNPSVTHQYKLKAHSNEPSIWSPFGGSSNVVQLLAPPAAPSNLWPSSIALDASEAITFTWRHGSVDTTTQVAYEVQYRSNGGAWITTGKVVSGVEARVIPAATFANRSTVEWQVRTWGEHATASPWSPAAILATSARPTATLTVPTNVVGSSQVTVRWIFFDGEGSTQTSYKIRLEDAAGASVWAGTIDSAGTSHKIPYTVADGATYTVYLAVRDGDGVWSYESSQTFKVRYAPPSAPVVEAKWDLDLGAVIVQIAHPAPGAGEVAATSAQVLRSADGDDWVVIADGLDPSTTITDFLPALDAVNYYRVVSFSALPSSRESAPIAVATASKGWVFVNGGPGFAQVTKIRDNVKTDYDLSRAKARNHYAGRTLTVETVGEERGQKIGLSGRIGGGSSSLREWEQAADLAAPLCYRDGTRRVFVSIDPVGTSYERIFQDISLNFEQVDFSE